MNDFASLPLARLWQIARTAEGRGRHRRQAVLCLLCCSFIMTASGCSWLPSVPMPRIWPFNGDDDSTTKVVEYNLADPEQIAAALAATRSKMQMAPQEPYWPFRMGELYAAVDSTTHAISHLGDALEVDPGYAPAAALLCKLYYDAEIYDQATFLLEDFLSRNADAPDALRVALALHLEALGELDRAQTVLDECSGDSEDLLTARTFVTLRGDDLSSALATAKRAVEGNPRSAANHNNYGIALLHAGRPVEAREAFQSALALDDKLPGALYNMAIVETFYFFDQSAGREWFALYKQHSSEDPDDLTSQFGADLSTLLESEGAE